MTGAKKNRKRHKIRKVILSAVLAAVLVGILSASVLLVRRMSWKKPQELLMEYMGYVDSREYGKMYEMIDSEESGGISREAFAERNMAIYEGIGAENVRTEILEMRDGGNTVAFSCVLDTVAGEISFENTASFVRTKSGYRLVWEDSMIFPQLGPDDKVRVDIKEAKRGKILDRNGQVLAGEGIASCVGIVPGKMTNREEAVRRIAALLEINEETVENKLSAQWVKEDSFVPIKNIAKDGAPDLTDMLLGEAFAREGSLEQELLEIPGVMITDVTVRSYPLGEAAAHLIGYVQSVTAEDLEEHAGEGYSDTSLIGRSGMESLFEKELKGQNGYQIRIIDASGETKTVLAVSNVQDGQDVQLTIDADLQKILYEQFQEDKSCTAAMDPYTGEVLALVSTPSYDNNDFILGLSDSAWEALNEDERNPLLNRFRQVWCPGSSLKPVIAAIGLDTGAIDPDEDYGSEGLSWQKDSSWGDYYVTTLHEYEPVTLQNALIYSDNIYFAKASLKIGGEQLAQSFDRLGFGTALPFEITVSDSQYSNTGEISSEVQLADSGYGQGEILVNPVHLAALYTAFVNQGNVIKPRLLYEEQTQPETWIPQAFTAETAETVLEGMKQVVNDPNGTGYAAHRDDILFAGKTGTAEIKATTEDTTGTELGWFAVFTADSAVENPLLLVSMTEDIKEIGGSGYVVSKIRETLEMYLP